MPHFQPAGSTLRGPVLQLLHRHARLPRLVAGARRRAPNLVMRVASIAASFDLLGWPTAADFSFDSSAGFSWPAVTLVAGLAGLAALVWLARWLTRTRGRALDRLDGFEGNNPRLTLALTRTDRFLVRTAILLVPVMAAVVLQAPPRITDALLLGLRIYLIVAAGLVVIRSAGVIVDAIESVGRRQAARRGLAEYVDRFGSLAPTLRTCLEWAFWFGLATALATPVAPTRTATRRSAPGSCWPAWSCSRGCAALELGYLKIDRRWILAWRTERHRHGSPSPRHDGPARPQRLDLRGALRHVHPRR